MAYILMGGLLTALGPPAFIVVKYQGPIGVTKDSCLYCLWPFPSSFVKKWTNIPIPQNDLLQICIRMRNLVVTSTLGTKMESLKLLGPFV